MLFCFSFQHESEILPFPNPEDEFALPDGDFGDLLSKRRGSKNAAPEGEPIKRPPSPAPKPSTGGKVNATAAAAAPEEEKPTATRRPEATGGKTGKGDWNAAKSSPVPSAGGKVRRNEAEAASRTGGKSDSTRKSDAALPSKVPPPSSVSGKVKPEYAHGKVKNDSTPTGKSSKTDSSSPAVSKPKSDGTGTSSKSKAEAPKGKGAESRSEAKQETTSLGSQTKPSRSETPKAPKGESKTTDSKGADPKGDSKVSSKTDSLPTPKRSEPSKLKERKSEGRSRGDDDSASQPAAKATVKPSKEESESLPKRKRASRHEQPKQTSPLVGNHNKRRR